MSKRMFIVFVFMTLWQMPAVFANEIAPEISEIEVSPPYFSDVQQGHAHYLAINYLYEEGIIDGYADGTFKSENKVNRAEALKMILNAFELESDKPTTYKDLETGKVYEITAKATESDAEISFLDVPEEVWYEDLVKKAVKNKLVNGYADGSFGPARPITLVEALKINLEADKAALPEEVPEEIFADVMGSDWFSAYVLYAKDLSILNIAASNTINPHQELSRGKLAELIYRIHKSRDGHKFGIASFYGDMFHGRTTASGDIFDNNAMTAASRTLSFGTMVRVTNPRDGKYVDVTITDRGPYVYGRVLDLSKAAFTQITHPGSGIVRVEYRIITQEEIDAEKQQMIIDSILNT